MSKYRNIPTAVDNILFASKKEAARYGDLKILQRLGVIRLLKIQPKFPIEINNQLVCTYVGDFSYFEAGRCIVEDVKGMKTQVYKLKKKLLLATHGIEIKEI